ncbi:hypothetical protein LG3211_3797 [Lysobacter gummosus]|nr:hypothetical protein LG3211_3797 [Lysobacter gummosus]
MKSKSPQPPFFKGGNSTGYFSKGAAGILRDWTWRVDSDDAHDGSIA